MIKYAEFCKKKSLKKKIESKNQFIIWMQSLKLNKPNASLKDVYKSIEPTKKILNV